MVRVSDNIMIRVSDTIMIRVSDAIMIRVSDNMPSRVSDTIMIRVSDTMSGQGWSWGSDRWLPSPNCTLTLGGHDMASGLGLELGLGGGT